MQVNKNMLKKILFTVLITQTTAYTSTTPYLQDFYDEPYSSQLYSFKKYAIPTNQTKQKTRLHGWYIEGQLAGRPNLSFLPLIKNVSSFQLPFSIKRRDRIVYHGSWPSKRLNINIDKRIFLGSHIGFRFSQFPFAIETAGFLLLFHEFHNQQAYNYYMGGIPSMRGKIIISWHDFEIYIKGGPAWPMAIVQEKKYEQVGPLKWVHFCNLFLSTGFSYAFSSNFRIDFSLHGLTPWKPNAEAQNNNKRRSYSQASSPTRNLSPHTEWTATWLQVGLNYRLM
jgi:hypothetical protein